MEMWESEGLKKEIQRSSRRFLEKKKIFWTENSRLKKRSSSKEENKKRI